MENTMDPSHANWLHDGAVGKWEDAHPMHMRLLDGAIDAHQVKIWILSETAIVIHARFY